MQSRRSLAAVEVASSGSRGGIYPGTEDLDSGVETLDATSRLDESSLRSSPVVVRHTGPCPGEIDEAFRTEIHSICCLWSDAPAHALARDNTRHSTAFAFIDISNAVHEQGLLVYIYICLMS